MQLPSLSSRCEIAQFYPSQTKISEGGTKDEMRIFAALFKGVSTQLWQLTIEKCFLRNPHFIFCSPFRNLRLGGVNSLFAKRRFCKSEPTFPNPTMSEMSRLNVQPHALGTQQVMYRRSLSRVQSKVASSKVFDYVARDVPVNLLIQVAP